MSLNSSEKAFKKVLSLCPQDLTTQKMMFGCPVIFVRGKMFAGIFKQSLFIRVGENKKLKMISSRKAKAFRAKGREMKQYVALSLSLVLTPETTRLVKSALRLHAANSESINEY